MVEHKKVELATLANGSAAELFQQELAKVLENILDPNTQPEATRTITMKLTFAPNQERTQTVVAVEASSKLANYRGTATTLFLGILHGQRVAIESNPAQLQMDFDAMSKPTNIRSVNDVGGDADL